MRAAQTWDKYDSISALPAKRSHANWQDKQEQRGNGPQIRKGNSQKKNMKSGDYGKLFERLADLFQIF